MASEFAEAVCQTYFNNTEGALLRNVVDAELEEVRTVLAALLSFSDEVIEAWNIIPLPAHRAGLNQARALMLRLQVENS